MKSINTALPPPPPHGFHSFLSPCLPFLRLPQTLSPIRQDSQGQPLQEDKEAL